MKILILDDDPNLHDIYRLYFEDEGYDIDCIYSAIDAGKKVITSQVESDHYDVVIVDFQLSGHTGGEFFKFLLSLDEKVKVPLIFLVSGHVTEEKKMLSPSGLHIVFLGKPVDLPKIKGIIEVVHKDKA